MSRQHPGRKPVIAMDSDELSDRGFHVRRRRAIGVMQHRLGQLDSSLAEEDIDFGVTDIDGFPAGKGVTAWPVQEPEVDVAVSLKDDGAEAYEGRHPSAALFARNARRVEVVVRKNRGSASK